MQNISNRIFKLHNVREKNILKYTAALFLLRKKNCKENSVFEARI